MATREKTVVYSFPMTTALVADAALTNLSQITIFIPESSPTFTSVFAEVGFMDAITATGGTITEHRVALRLGAAAYTTFTELDDITNTAENIAGVIGPINFTSHFTTNWTGTSMTCDLQVYFDQTTGTTLGMRNVTALLYVTYTYNDDTGVNATQLKTVRIPLESLVGTLPTTATNFGTSQIPALDTFLPEASKTIRDYFFVIEGNEATNNTTTDFTISVNIDGGATTTFQIQESALASDRFCRWIYKPSVPSTASTHNIQVWSSVTNKANHCVIDLVVTYEFNASTTTRLLNSIRVPIEIASPLGATAVADISRFNRLISVQEPGTINLRQSAFRINWNSAGGLGTPRFRAGAQAYRAYTDIANVTCGMFCLQQRIDSGSAQGAGFTAARGFNEITIDGYGSSATVEATNLNGYITLNYESDVGAGGVGQNSHTVQKLVNQWDALLVDRVTIANWSFPIPEANYWLVSAGFCMTYWSAASNALSLDAEVNAGEGKGDGYTDIYVDVVQQDAELGCSFVWMRGRDVFRRFPNDADTSRLDIEGTRDLRAFFANAVRFGLVSAVTYHSFTGTVSGTITGNDAGLTTTLRLVRTDLNEVMQTQTLAAGTTSYTFTTNDNTQTYYVDAYQDATHVGRSAQGTPT
jgi:hypothetical protein